MPQHDSASSFQKTRPKRSQKTRELALLAAVEGDAFGVLAQPHQAEAQIGLEALLVEIQRDQRPAEPDGEPGRDAV